MPFDIDAYFADRQRVEDERARAAETVGAVPEEEKSSLLDIDDALLFAPRAVEGYGRSVLSLIPGVDLTEDRFLGRSDTMIGSFFETATQFGIGFVPALGVAGKVAQLSKVQAAARGLQVSKTGRFFLASTKGSIAGAVADFTAFDGHEKNLSAMLESMPGLTNPVTQFLATDEEDPEIVGRIKNTIEGFGVGAALGGVFELVMQGLRGLKAIRKARTIDATPETLRAAETAAVDPATADQALGDTLQNRSRKTDEDLLEAETVEVPERTSEELATELTGDPEAAQEFIEGYAESRLTREDAGGSARPRKTEGGVGRDEYELKRDRLTRESKNIGRIVREQGAAHALRTAEDLAEKELPKTITNAEMLAMASADLASYTGLPQDQVIQALSHSVRNAADQTRAGAVKGLAAAQVLGAQAREIASNIEAYLGGSAEAYGKVLTGIEGFNDLRNAVFDLKGAQAQALQSNAIQLGVDTPGDRLARILADGAMGKPGQLDSLMEQMRAAYGDGNSIDDVASMLELQNMTLGRKVGKATFELFYNFILSAPRTFVIQPLSSTLVSIFRPLENMMGGAIQAGIKGNPILQDPIVRRSLFELTHLHTGFMDSLRAAAKTFRTGAPQFDPGVGLRDDRAAQEAVIRAGLFGGEQDSITNAGLDWIGKVVRMPTRLIGTADEFSKQMRGRSVLRAQAMVDAMSKHGNADAAVEAAEETMSRLVKDGQLQNEAVARQLTVAQAKEAGLEDPIAIAKYVEDNYLDNFSQDHSGVMERALDEAREATLQTPLEPVDDAWRKRNPDAGLGTASNVQRALDAVPGLRFIVPFFRTPLNAAKFVGQREPVTNMLRYHLSKPFTSMGPGLEASRNRFVRDLVSEDPERVADATGRMATGLMLFTTGASLAASGQITGRGPTDPDIRKAMLDAGWQPYSIRTPNGYVQYLRMEPFSVFFGLMADYADGIRLAGNDEDEDFGALTMPMLTALANNFTQRSFLVGLGNFFDALSDPSRNMGGLVEQFAGSVVPNGLAHATELFGDEALRETNGVLERIMSRIPGYSETAPARRNLLGEPIVKSSGFAADLGVDPVEKFLGMFNPIMYREVSSDIIRRELFSLQHGFQPPKTKILGLDLRQEVTSTGQPAHDRWAELHGQVRVGGKTLRQELSSLIRSRKYKELSGFPSLEGPSPRVALINQVVSRFRDAAFDQMLREAPEVAAEIERREGRLKDIRAGATATRRDGLSAVIGNFPTTF